MLSARFKINKLMLRIVINRTKKKLEQEISITQAGFKEGTGTRDHIVNVRNIITEKCKEHRTKQNNLWLTEIQGELKAYYKSSIACKSQIIDLIIGNNFGIISRDQQGTVISI